MSSVSKGTGKKVAIGAVVAGVIGYAAGILTAPKSGKETREDIKHTATKAKTQAEKKLKELHSELNRQLELARKKGSKLTGRARDELDKAVASADTVKEKVRLMLSALHEGDADDPELKQALKDAQNALKQLEKFVKK